MGFSETYKQLLDDKELGLERRETKVRTATLVSLTETPKYSVKPFRTVSNGKPDPDAPPARRLTIDWEGRKGSPR